MQYEIRGGNLPVVICTLEQGESIMTQGGGMSWMGPNMKMETKMGGLSKGITRKFMKESAFLNHYTAVGGPGLISFASSFPGEIIPFEIGPGKDIILQKRSFLAASTSIDISIYFQKRLGAAIWGGEGFVMQKLSGNGVVFAEMDGSVMEYDLGAGDRILMDTGYLAAMEETCTMDIQAVPGVKNLVFGGEGIFNTVVTGPGKVWIQSIPVSRLASTMSSYLVVKKE